jgi:SPP1 gp7 family putative phage head morphogenesis protein
MRRLPRLHPRRPRAPPYRQRLPIQAQPDAIAARYIADLRDIAIAAKAMVVSQIAPLVERHLKSLREDEAIRDETIRLDSDVPGEIIRLLRGIKFSLGRTFPEDALGRIVKNRAEQLDLFNRGAVADLVDTVSGIDVFGRLAVDTKATIAAWTKENIALIKSIPDVYLGDVERLVVDAFQRGRRPEAVMRDLLRNNFLPDEARPKGAARDPEARARLIARDQAGKLNAALTKTRHQELGLDHYIWRTSLDGSVREEHAELEGMRFSWDDPPDEGHPGEPVGCRCRAEPDMSEILGIEPEGPRAVG